MAGRAFVVMQVGAKDSPERKRADEIYSFIVAPAIKEAGLEPYRADLDLSPGGITSKMLSELLNARVVIADLTGRNPNVFYELGITHSFARPLISIADSARSLPFDTKDERVIELGEYSPVGLTYVQGEQAKTALRESLRIVLADNYSPPSPLREVAANRSVDQLAPSDPVAAEMAQMRETLEVIRRRMPARTALPPNIRADIRVLRDVIERNVAFLDDTDFEMLSTNETSAGQDRWSQDLYARKTVSEQRARRTRAEVGQDSLEIDTSRQEETTTDEPPF